MELKVPDLHLILCDFCSEVQVCHLKDVVPPTLLLRGARADSFIITGTGHLLLPAWTVKPLIQDAAASPRIVHTTV